jgi:hypothetical protein
VIQKQFGSQMRSTLVNDPGGAFYYTYSDTAFNNLASSSAGIYTAYGVDSAATLRFPFNRTDYFVATPTDPTAIPSYCAKGTGVLYKTTVNHADGKLTYIPILDCVLDMQVVLGWDIDGDGVIDTWSNADGSFANTNPYPAQFTAAVGTNNNSITTVPNIRNNLKMIKVYILAQNGKYDPSYTSQSPLNVFDSGESSNTGRPTGFALSATTNPSQLNYRWKLYRIVVRPKNLLSNQ